MTAEIFTILPKAKQQTFTQKLPNSKLMANINHEIEKAGGWYIWRDSILLENNPYSDGSQRKRIYNRLTHHNFKNKLNIQITRSHID